jgi:hypothetical protein
MARTGTSSGSALKSPATTMRALRSSSRIWSTNTASAITVRSVHRSNPRTYGMTLDSSKGPTLDGRKKPRPGGAGERITSAATGAMVASVPVLTPNSRGALARYRGDSGTSMSAAHVSGVLAAFLSARPEFIGQPQLLNQIFMDGATDLGRNEFYQGAGGGGKRGGHRQEAARVCRRRGRSAGAGRESTAGFDRPSTTANARRILVSRADELCHARDDAALRGGYDRQRASLWLALVGLWGVIAIGSVLGHIETMLMGAIGGFLAPLIDARLSEAKQSTWGVRVLSPVGGALTAVGGLLVVSFLADPDVDLLGGVFRNNSWNNPTTQVALALALLFGFSRKLFSSAITAGSQFAASSPPGAPDAAGATPPASEPSR